ncbi:MAG: hypothetical protein RLZZ441_417 [Actinomycetota bacterium]
MPVLQTEQRTGEGDEDSHKDSRSHELCDVQPRGESNDGERRVAGLRDSGKVARNSLGFVCSRKLNECTKNSGRKQDSKGGQDRKRSRVANGRHETNAGYQQERGRQLSDHEMGPSPIPQVEEFFFCHGAILPCID